MKLHFDKPLKIKDGKYVMNSYIQENDLKNFWKIWHEKKIEIKKNGFSLNKYNKKWQLSYWTNDINEINNKCNELCKKIGFIEDKIDIPYEILLKIIRYVDLSTLIILRYTCKKIYIEIEIMLNNNKILYDINLPLLDFFEDEENYIKKIKTQITDIKINITENRRGVKKCELSFPNEVVELNINNISYIINMKLILYKLSKSGNISFSLYFEAYRINNNKNTYNNIDFNKELHSFTILMEKKNCNLTFNDIFRIYLLLIFNFNENYFFYIYNNYCNTYIGGRNIFKTININNYCLDIFSREHVLINDNGYILPYGGKLHSNTFTKGIYENNNSVFYNKLYK